MENKGKEGRREREGSRGSFNNYVDQVFPNFDPCPPRQLWTFYMIPPLFAWPSVDFLLNPPPLLVHVVIEWSLVELSSEKKQKTGSWIIVIAAAGACFSFISLFEAITFCLLPITVTENSTFCPKTLSVLRPLLCEICTAWTVNNVYVDPHPFCFEYIHTLLIQ
jgi:hypothetical protein